MFLLGDAAHVHLPIGAQGMSAGVGDAVNLGWKLGAEINGHAPDGLLDTYHGERHPVAARILANTLAQRILYLSGDEHGPDAGGHDRAAGVRGGPAAAGRHGHRPGHPVRRRARAATRCSAGGCPAPSWSATSGKANAFAFLHAGRGVLYDLGGDGELRAAAAPWADRIDVVTTTSRPDGALADVEAALVRPDGYVAWIGHGRGRGGRTDGRPHPLVRPSARESRGRDVRRGGRTAVVRVP